MTRSTHRSFLLLALAGPLLLPALLAAQEPAAAATDDEISTLPAGEAGDFLGEWVLTVESPQGAFDLDFTMVDEDGTAVATFDMPRAGSRTVRHIVKTDDGIQLLYDLAFGEQTFDMHMNVKRTEEGLIGKMADSNGLFSMTFTGIDRQRFLAEDSESGDGQRRRRRGSSTETVELALDGDEESTVRLRFDQVPTTDASYALLENPEAGEVIPFIEFRPMKLWNPVDLKFGEVTVEAHNYTPDYPGVYSLWLLHEDGRWHLVFNHLADVWGTQHDPEKDAARVPLQAVESDESSDVLTAELLATEQGAGGTLRIKWGEWVLSAPFEAAEGTE